MELHSTRPCRVRGWQAWAHPEVPIRLGVSACLLGDEVRYDGQHARDSFVHDVLGSQAEWHRVCPEMELGMGTPRPTIRLEQRPDGVHLIAPSSGADHTAAMQSFAAERIERLGIADLDGYVVKKNSPSCGLARLPIWKDGQKTSKDGVGFFTRALQQADPLLPIEEEGRLHDPVLREAFIDRIFCRNRWHVFLAGGPTRNKLVEFHTSHKMLLRAHDEAGYQLLGNLVGQAGRMADEQLFARYGAEFLVCVARRASRRRHCNVLHHAMGYFKRQLASGDKQLLLEAIEDFRAGHVALTVPLALIRFNIEQLGVEYLAGQVYFDPYPKQWMLRNHTQ
ncbi:MAG: DUF523 and DUF1722 domain-containing protein [Planctomycetota bacterium]